MRLHLLSFTRLNSYSKYCIALFEEAGLDKLFQQKGYVQAEKFSLERMGRELMSVYVKARAEGLRSQGGRGADGLGGQR